MDADRPAPVHDARVLGDLIDRERRTGAAALRALAGGADRTYDYRNLCATAHRAGNFLRHLGVRGGAAAAADPARGTVAVVPDPAPEVLLTFLGAAAVGGATRFGPPDGEGARVVVVPVATVEGYDLPSGTKPVAYGGDPGDPSVEHWEAQVWSENPAAPPANVAPDDPVLRADRAYTHADLLAGARAVVDRLDLDPGDAVAVRSSLGDPRTVAAGVVAPLLVGGVVVLPGRGRGKGPGAEERARVSADAAVGGGPEPETISLDDVPL